MLTNNYVFSGLIISALLILSLLLFTFKQKRNTNLKKSFSSILVCLLICCIGLICQISLSVKMAIPPIYFDYFVYIGTCFLPVTFLIMSLTFVKPDSQIDFKKLTLALSVVPVICLISLWTNDIHHSFYKVYSIYLSEGEYGIFFYITSIYTYSLTIYALIQLLNYSIKNIKTYILQSLFIFLGALVPIIVNFLGLVGFFDLSIYITPICFSITILCFALSIFKFGFLKIRPIALQKIVNTISDSYIVLDSNMLTVDCNNTFLKTFGVKKEQVINKDFFNTSIKSKVFKSALTKIHKAVEKTIKTTEPVPIDMYFSGINKYFHIEITSIYDKKIFMGTLLLFKDVTQHKLDLETIKNNQDILIEKERLASLGQMIGGIAHNLKTPIMSISGAAEGIIDLINEYKASIGDPEVTVEDHLAIAADMEEWISKIRVHLSYMSDVITTVKGQAVAFSDNSSFVDFTIDDLIKQVDILMKHELNHSQTTLEKIINLPTSTVVKGNINSLVQVLNNIISNAIQAYNGKTGEKIILDISKLDKNLIIKIQDFAGGIPDNIKNKLFKEMTTTKGKNGTGLGLFMSYSNIKAHFNGNLRFETENGKGTTFIIEIPA